MRDSFMNKEYLGEKQEIAAEADKSKECLIRQASVYLKRGAEVLSILLAAVT